MFTNISLNFPTLQKKSYQTRESKFTFLKALREKLQLAPVGEKPPKWSQPYIFKAEHHHKTTLHIDTHCKKQCTVCVALLHDDTPLWKCKAGLKLSGRSPGTGCSLELFP